MEDHFNEEQREKQTIAMMKSPTAKKYESLNNSKPYGAVYGTINTAWLFAAIDEVKKELEQPNLHPTDSIYLEGRLAALERCEIDVFRNAVKVTRAIVNDKAIEYKDALHNITECHFSFWDRLKILFGKHAFVRNVYYTKNDQILNVATESSCWVEPILIGKKHVGMISCPDVL